jgi:hypothetical protein
MARASLLPIWFDMAVPAVLIVGAVVAAELGIHHGSDHPGRGLSGTFVACHCASNAIATASSSKSKKTSASQSKRPRRDAGHAEGGSDVS